MSHNKTSFKLPLEECRLNENSLIEGFEAIYFTYMSDMATIASIIPPPLEPAMPLVSGYIAELHNPPYAVPYMEAMLGVYVKYNDQIGMYPVAFLLSGDGAEMGTYLGRHKAGLPKKICDAAGGITLEKEGDRVRGIVERKGVRLLDVSLKLGEYNNPMTGDIYFNPEPGKKTGGVSWYFKPYIQGDSKGNTEFRHIDFVSNEVEYTYYDWQPGKASIRVESSKDDAWGQLPVVEILGGAYAKNDLEMKEIFLIDELSPDEVLPYLISARYDKEALV